MSVSKKYEKYLVAARPHLETEEKVIAGVLGAYEAKMLGDTVTRYGILLATDRRVVFFSKKLTGYEMESFPYPNVSSFEQGKNMMGHTIRLFASGNQVDIKWIPAGSELQQLTQEVKRRMHQPTSVSISSPVPESTDDVFDQLSKLGQLRDTGVITDAEFEAKKSVLLQRI